MPIIIYITKACHENPSQYIRAGTPINNINSRVDKSAGILYDKELEKPNSAFIHDLKKKVGPSKYKNTSRNTVRVGKRSKKKEKKRNSDTKNMDPGNPKNIRVFNNAHRNNLGHIKLIPLTSVINLVLKRLATASTNKNEFVDNKA